MKRRRRKRGGAENGVITVYLQYFKDGDTSDGSGAGGAGVTEGNWFVNVMCESHRVD